MKMADLKTKKDQSLGQISFYISLSDLMILLCVFFTVMVGMSRIEIGSFEKVRTAVTGTTQGTLVQLAKDLESIAHNQKGVSVRLAEDGVRLDVETAALFDTASAVLKKEALKPLEPLLLKILATRYQVDVEGHTDDRPLFDHEGDEVETNWSLSGRRASSVVQYLIGMGFPDKRLRIIGYASNRPKVKIGGKSGDQLEYARAENRRVSVLIKGD